MHYQIASLNIILMFVGFWIFLDYFQSLALLFVSGHYFKIAKICSNYVFFLSLLMIT